MPAASPEVLTHVAIDHRLSGTPLAVGDGRAEVELIARREMAADDHGLVHGGFVFSLADHAAMLAVNRPTVVLAAADTRFLAPVAVGERLVARARVTGDVAESGRTPRPVVEVEVVADSGGDATPVFTGTFRCAVPREHVMAARARRSRPQGAAR